VIAVVVVLCAGAVGTFYAIGRAVSNAAFVTVELSVTGQGNADITYDLGDGELDELHGLPWTTTARLSVGVPITLRALPYQAGSGLVCTIKVNGALVTQQSSSGPSQPVVCATTS